MDSYFSFVFSSGLSSMRCRRGYACRQAEPQRRIWKMKTQRFRNLYSLRERFLEGFWGVSGCATSRLFRVSLKSLFFRRNNARNRFKRFQFKILRKMLLWTFSQLLIQQRTDFLKFPLRFPYEKQCSELWTQTHSLPFTKHRCAGIHVTKGSDLSHMMRNFEGGPFLTQLIRKNSL